MTTGRPPCLLLLQVGRLAAEGCYDYCVIESTGIGEPMQVGEVARLPGTRPVASDAQPVQLTASCQTRLNPALLPRCLDPFQVAETFALAAGEGGPPLADVATLDTCVTVVDAANLMANL